jgi:hypothetical protein
MTILAGRLDRFVFWILKNKMAHVKGKVSNNV